MSGTTLSATGGGGGISSINSDTSPAQTIAGADDISVSTAGGTTTVRRAQAAAGTPAYLMFPYGHPFGAATSGALVTSANQIRRSALRVVERIPLANIGVSVQTTSAGGSMSFGIYSADCSARLFYSGVMSTAVSGNITAALAASGTIAPGDYILMWTADNTTVQLRTGTIDGTFGSLWNLGTVRYGTDSNPSSGGALPTTCGTPTASTNINPPAVAFY
jgi:hypothetical protein